MGWDGTAMNCYGMGWDGTEKYVPWTSLLILINTHLKLVSRIKLEINWCKIIFVGLGLLVWEVLTQSGKFAL